MKTVCEKNMCNGCTVCISICPKKCIAIEDNMETLNAVINQTDCINCQLCKKICPNINNAKKIMPIKFNQGWTNSNFRQNSASGGVASSIIYNFIKNGGYVASCLFKSGDFVFDITNDLDKVKEFAGSKYVKSNPIGIYERIAETLKTNKVLFIGLPCQVAGLKNYINHKNLYTIDLICHGTPSIKMLKKYLIEHKFDLNNCKNIQFRKKTVYGLKVNNCLLDLEGKDDYILSFVNSINFTQNCYSCNFASLDRVSDLTLGDSWGTSYTEEEKKGVSLILIQSEKGRKLLENASLDLKEVDIQKALEKNDQLKHPALLKKERTKFFNVLKNGGTIRKATFVIYKKVIIKRYIKMILYKFHLRKPKKYY